MSCDFNDPKQIQQFIIDAQWKISFLRLFLITRELILFLANHGEKKSRSLKAKYANYIVPKKQEKITGGDVPHDLLVFFRFCTKNALEFVNRVVDQYKHHSDYEKDKQEVGDAFKTLLTNNDSSIHDCVKKFVDIIRNCPSKRKRKLDQ